MTRQFVCGDPDGPVAGQTIFKARFLKDVFVNFIIVNNVTENQLEPSPGFIHSYVKGEISRGANPWITGDKLIIDFTKCKLCD